MGRLRANLSVIGALGWRSVKQTFRRPQLMAPIIVFPTLLLAIQTAGAGRAVDLPAFPEVNGFLDFMLAGAMIQSTLLAGNTGGIALALDIEMGFTDRLFAAPISRFAIVLGRLIGTFVLGAATAVWFLAIGLVFGATIEDGVAGVLLIVALVAGSAVAFGGLGAAIALRVGRVSVVQGLFPIVFVILFLSSAFFPANLMLEPAASIAEYNPLSFIVEAVRDLITSTLSAEALAEALGALALIGAIGFGARGAGAATPAEDGRLMEASAATVQRGLSRATAARPPGDAAGADAPGGERAPARSRGGDPGGPGADDLLPRADRGVRQPDPAPRLHHRHLPELHHPDQHAPGRRLHRRRHRRQPRPRHRAGLVRPPGRLPRPALGPARRDGPLGQRARADPGDRGARASASRSGSTGRVPAGWRWPCCW